MRSTRIRCGGAGTSPAHKRPRIAWADSVGVPSGWLGCCCVGYAVFVIALISYGDSDTPRHFQYLGPRPDAGRDSDRQPYSACQTPEAVMMASVTKPSIKPAKMPQVVITLKSDLRATASSSITTYKIEPAAKPKKAVDTVALTKC